MTTEAGLVQLTTEAGLVQLMTETGSVQLTIEAGSVQHALLQSEIAMYLIKLGYLLADSLYNRTVKLLHTAVECLPYRKGSYPLAHCIPHT